uniref:Uncharacterized protein n=1 Tax=Mustela putorius furo TaxID=9669 RepID=M3Z6Y6_MUSPF
MTGVHRALGPAPGVHPIPSESKHLGCAVPSSFPWARSVTERRGWRGDEAPSPGCGRWGLTWGTGASVCPAGTLASRAREGFSGPETPLPQLLDRHSLGLNGANGLSTSSELWALSRGRAGQPGPDYTGRGCHWAPFTRPQGRGGDSDQPGPWGPETQGHSGPKPGLHCLPLSLALPLHETSHQDSSVTGRSPHARTSSLPRNHTEAAEHDCESINPREKGERGNFGKVLPGEEEERGRRSPWRADRDASEMGHLLPGGSRQEAQGQRLGVCPEEEKFRQDCPRNCSSVLVAGEEVSVGLLQPSSGQTPRRPLPTGELAGEAGGGTALGAPGLHLESCAPSTPCPIPDSQWSDRWGIWEG